jgi:hypothetical protein
MIFAENGDNRYQNPSSLIIQNLTCQYIYQNNLDKIESFIIFLGGKLSRPYEVVKYLWDL